MRPPVGLALTVRGGYLASRSSAAPSLNWRVDFGVPSAAHPGLVCPLIYLPFPAGGAASPATVKYEEHNIPPPGCGHTVHSMHILPYKGGELQPPGMNPYTMSLCVGIRGGGLCVSNYTQIAMHPVHIVAHACYDATFRMVRTLVLIPDIRQFVHWEFPLASK